MAASLLINVLMIAAFIDGILQTFSKQMLERFHIIRRDKNNVLHAPVWIGTLQVIGMVAAIMGLFLVHDEEKFLFGMYMFLIMGARVMANMNYVSTFANKVYNLCLLTVTFTILVKGFMIHKDYIVYLFTR